MAVKLDSATMQAALVGYQRQLDEIQAKMAELRQQLGRTRRPVVGENGTARTSSPRKHRMSAEGRARIAAAQRARWAKAKKAAKRAAADE